MIDNRYEMTGWADHGQLRVEVGLRAFSERFDLFSERHFWYCPTL